MTATKMNAQEIIQFIANAEKKTSVKVTFEGQLATARTFFVSVKPALPISVTS